MFRHVVLFQWKEDASADQRAAAVDALRQLAEQVAHLGRLTVGTDAGLREDNADVAVVVDFDSVADYHRYAADDAHQRVIKEFLQPIVAKRVAVQHELTAP